MSGKFGKFLGGNKASDNKNEQSPTGTSLTTSSGGRRAITKNPSVPTTATPATQVTRVDRLAQYVQRGIDQSGSSLRSAKFALCLDGTGSMAQLIRATIEALKTIGAKLEEGVSGADVLIQVFVYRDYTDGP